MLIGRIVKNIKKEGLKSYIVSRTKMESSWIKYRYINYAIYLMAKCGIKLSQFKKMEEFKDIHKGERCFIICTGPSLTLEDVEKLRNEVTFTMNSFVYSLDEISFSPDYYAFTDSYGYTVMRDEVKKNRYKFKAMFSGANDWKREWLKDADWVRFLQIKESGLWRYNKPELSFSTDPSRGVFECGTVVYTVIQIAFYMGFSEVYLIGADCGYMPNAFNYNDDKFDLDDNTHRAWEGHFGLNKMWELGYIKAKEFADEHGIKFRNATRGGFLDVLDRVDLDEVLLNDA